MNKLILFLILSIFSLHYAIADCKQIKDLEAKFEKSTLGIPDWKKIIAASDELIKCKPDHPEANFERGIAHAQLGKYQDAIPSFDTAIKYHHLAKEFNRIILNDSYYRRGYCLEELGKLEEALESYDKAIKYGCPDRYLYFLRDGVLMKLGKELD